MNYDSAGSLRVNNEGQKPQYSTAFAFPIGSGTQQIFGMYGVSGGELSGGRIVRIQRLELQLSSLSGFGYADVMIVQQTSGFVSGYAAVVTSGALHDLTDIFPSGNIVYYSGAQTASGASWGLGGLYNRRILGIINPSEWGNPTSGAQGFVSADNWVHDFALINHKQPTLRNAFQGISVVMGSGYLKSGRNAALVFSGAVTQAMFRFVWVEETNLT